MADYNPGSIEPKWQKIWDEKRSFAAPDIPEGQGFYCLEMLPYPSGRIHMGHVRNYSIGDVVARFKKMRGLQVMHPMGWDSFGMPAENAAIQRGLHPRDWTESNIIDMRSQLKKMGFAYDWSREIASHRPDYYRWNQWLFIRMFERGLAYRSLRLVNWCPQCATVLANEQVEQGACWRCGTPVVQKSLDQWFFRISRYADELLADLDKMPGWPEKVLTMQRNWIGRSEGAFVDFRIAELPEADPIRVFTTRIDTIFGATFLALAPAHATVGSLLEGSEARTVADAFIAAERAVPVGERLSGEREKTGVSTGRHAVNPFTGERIPIWIANFVLMEYGTGAIMGVPGHDERDAEFARRYGLPIVPVIDGEGRTIDSGRFSGLPCERARGVMTQWARDNGFGEASVQFRLKDWGISRQRYWGTPIPMIHCTGCGIVPVPDAELPVVLPDDVSITGAGGSPLESSASFVNVACPQCKTPAKRDTDTMDTFVDSSWYFYRYLDPRNDRAPFRPEVTRGWFPIDLYIGGITHAILHLMYARFFSMVMRDIGLGTPGEPVTNLLTQGMVLKGGTAMSKSRGNVVAPDEMIEKYGADVTRLFVLFAAPPEKDLEWSESGIDGLHRFARRAWRLIDAHAAAVADAPAPSAASEIRRRTHQTLARVTDDIDRRLHLNTAISAIMELVNAIYLFAPPEEPIASRSAEDRAALKEALETLTICLGPFAPHMAEEAWSMLGGVGYVAHGGLLVEQRWPEADARLLTLEEVTIVVQVNGKVRGRVEVPQGAAETLVLEAVRRNERLASMVFAGESSRVVKTVFVPDKLLNVVVTP